jgi:hypothetical protein
MSQEIFKIISDKNDNDKQRKTNYTLHICFVHTYIHTYRSRFIPEGVAETSQIFLQDVKVLLKLYYI